MNYTEQFIWENIIGSCAEELVRERAQVTVDYVVCNMFVILLRKEKFNNKTNIFEGQ